MYIQVSSDIHINKNIKPLKLSVDFFLNLTLGTNNYNFFIWISWLDGINVITTELISKWF
jgi:hypothetical protein